MNVSSINGVIGKGNSVNGLRVWWNGVWGFSMVFDEKKGIWNDKL